MSDAALHGALMPWRLPGFAAALRQGQPHSPSRVPVPAPDALQQREPDAWTALFEREMPAIFRYCRGRLGDAGRAEDATAEVFEHAWRSAANFRDVGLPPRAWLFGIARNVVSSHRRWLFRQPAQVTLDAFDGPGEERALAPDRLDLAAAIARLEPRHAEVIMLRFVHDLSLEETAGALSVSIDAVKGRQARALSALKAILSGSEG